MTLLGQVERCNREQFKRGGGYYMVQSFDSHLALASPSAFILFAPSSMIDDSIGGYRKTNKDDYYLSTHQLSGPDPRAFDRAPKLEQRCPS